jgi:hypothetical protein
VYAIEAGSRQQAIDRMVEAIVTRLDRIYHVKDMIQYPGAHPKDAQPVDLHAARWLALQRRRLSALEKRLSQAAQRYFARAGT